MDLLEYQGKQLFARHGLKVSDGRAVTTVEDAVAAANEVGYPIVVKAQVLIGGRGKAGGVKLADDEAHAREHAQNILGMDISGHTVRTLWIEHASDIATEYYASVLLDRSAKQPLIMFSVQGGIDIEEVAEQTPEKLIRRHVDALKGLSREQAVEIATEGGADEDVIEGVADALVALYEVWMGEDATLAEINPLIVTPEREVKALDSKVSLDGNALYRHPENQGLSDSENEDPIERRASEQGVQYVALDGDIGILGNGAGLVMSTLDVVAQAGGKPANFLDAGGRFGRREDQAGGRADPRQRRGQGRTVQHLRRDHPLRRGCKRPDRRVCGHQTDGPVRRPAGRHERCRRPRAAAGGGAAERVRRQDDERGGGEGRGACGWTLRRASARGRWGRSLMSVLIDSDTRLAVAGITGKEGAFHTLNNRRYGTNVVGGVTPGKGGQDVEGIPVFDSWADAVKETQPNTAMIFVPPRFAADSILEAAAAGVELVIAITEGIPAHDELRVYNTLLRDHPSTRLIGPNCPGILSPGKANVGIIPASFFEQGNVGVVSRSGTLTYQIGNEIAQAGFGCSSIVGIGGDPVPGSSFVDVIALFEDDPETELIVLSGEIGGSAEEEAAELHRRERDQARDRLHRRVHRAGGQADGSRRRDRIGLGGHRQGEGGCAGSAGRACRAHPHRSSRTGGRCAQRGRLGQWTPRWRRRWESWSASWVSWSASWGP